MENYQINCIRAVFCRSKDLQKQLTEDQSFLQILADKTGLNIEFLINHFNIIIVL